MIKWTFDENFKYLPTIYNKKIKEENLCVRINQFTDEYPMSDFKRS